MEKKSSSDGHASPRSSLNGKDPNDHNIVALPTAAELGGRRRSFDNGAHPHRKGTARDQAVSNIVHGIVHEAAKVMGLDHKDEGGDEKPRRMSSRAASENTHELTHKEGKDGNEDKQSSPTTKPMKRRSSFDGILKTLGLSHDTADQPKVFVAPTHKKSDQSKSGTDAVNLVTENFDADY